MSSAPTAKTLKLLPALRAALSAFRNPPDVDDDFFLKWDKNLIRSWKKKCLSTLIHKSAHVFLVKPLRPTPSFLVWLIWLGVGSGRCG